MADIRTTGLLTTFDGPEEYPLSESGKFGPVDTTWNQLRRTGGGDAGSNPPSGLLWSLWTPQVFTGNCECWGYPVGGGLGVAGEGWRLGLWANSSLGGGGSAAGYVGFYFQALGEVWGLRRYSNATTFVTLDESPGSTPGGNRMLLRRNGDDVELWLGTSETSWTLMCSATDTTYQNAMHISLSAEDPTSGGVGWTGFGGGQRTKTRIYRYVSN